MYILSSRPGTVFLKTLALLMIVSVIAAPISDSSGVEHPSEGTSQALVKGRKRVKNSNPTLAEMIFILKREQRSDPEGASKMTLISANTVPVQPEEYLTAAFLPKTTVQGNRVRSGLRTIREKAENGRYKWKNDVFPKQQSKTQVVLPYVYLNHEYEVLGTVELSMSARLELTGALKRVDASVTLLYINAIVRMVPNILEEIKEKLGSEHVSGIPIDLEMWNSKFYAPMLNKGGSGAGFVITKEKYPDEWELYVEAVKELTKGGKEYGLDWTRWQKDAGTPLPDSPTLLAMEAALFPNGSASSLSADELKYQPSEA
ncbi:hypothetical protein F5880DRAFT_1614776 [Lentinula raphanica]|nr:hypothetical protein F5880DRAFT_1614776 [Lentinula raphanica]